MPTTIPWSAGVWVRSSRKPATSAWPPKPPMAPRRWSWSRKGATTSFCWTSRCPAAMDWTPCGTSGAWRRICRCWCSAPTQRTSTPCGCSGTAPQGISPRTGLRRSWSARSGRCIRDAGTSRRRWPSGWPSGSAIRNPPAPTSGSRIGSFRYSGSSPPGGRLAGSRKSSNAELVAYAVRAGLVS